MELSSIDRSLVIWIMTPVSVDRDLMANMAIGSLLCTSGCTLRMALRACSVYSTFPAVQDLAIEHLWVFWLSGSVGVGVR